MIVEPVGASAARIVHLEPRRDQRGTFSRVWCDEEFRSAGIPFTPIQANCSVTRGRGTIRGMHFQQMPRPDAKLVRVTRGRIYDVIVDLRGLFPTHRDVFAMELSEERPASLYIPAGFAHGFQSLTDEAVVEYLMDEVYRPELCTGFRYDDPLVSIAWPLPVGTISERDLAWPSLQKQNLLCKEA